MPTRLACDRCHDQKLRCIKSSGNNASCNRCLAVGASCRFSPSMRGVRPHKTNRSRSSPSFPSLNVHHAIDQHNAPETIDPVALLWDTPLHSNSLLTPEPRGQQQFSNLNNDVDFLASSGGTYGALGSDLNMPGDVVDGNAAITAHATDDAEYRTPLISGSRSSAPSTIDVLDFPSGPEAIILDLERSMNQLSQHLSEHAAKIPPLSIWGNSRLARRDEHVANTPGVAAMDTGTACCPSEDMNFHIDDTFTLTEAAIDMANRFTDILRQHRHWPEATTTLLPHFTPYGHVSSPSLMSFGLSSLYLFLSCHNRVLDIWALTFVHIRNCARASQEKTAATAEPTVMRVPKVRIGSFTPSMSTALDLQLSLMNRGATQLEEGIRALITEISLPYATATTDSTASMGDADRQTDRGLRSTSAVSLCRAALERAGEMVRDVESIRQMIEQVIVHADGDTFAR